MRRNEKDSRNIARFLLTSSQCPSAAFRGRHIEPHRSTLEPIPRLNVPLLRRAALYACLFSPALLLAQERPLGTLREQAALQQAWLQTRLDSVLPPLMR